MSDNAGKIWFRAGSNELGQLNATSGAIKRFTMDNSRIPSDKIYSLLESNEGRIWMSSINGLFALNPSTEEFKSYPLPTGQIIGPSFCNPDGKLFFLSKDGYYAYHPDDFISEDLLTIPKILISDFILDDKRIIPGNGSILKEPIWKTKSIDLSHKQNSFAFGMTCIDYHNPSTLQFKYQLQKYESAPREDLQQGLAMYKNVPPGTYLFKIQGADSKGTWNREGVTLQIRIHPPWWSTWWAYVAYSLFAAIAVWAFLQWQTKTLRTRQKMLEQTVADRTAEIFAEQQRSNELLLNILPAEVARELKETGKTKPIHFERVSILFADFKGFTNIAASIPGEKLIEELGDIFTQFDDIMDEVGLEKIQTIGDAYVAAGGLPVPDPDHAKRCVLAAQKMIAYLSVRNETHSIKWVVRVGIHSGPITAGVVGKKKFSYDLFGDTINIAARIESCSEPGRINVSAYSYDLIQHEFPCTYRGKIDAKGKGELDMYFVN
ncbi:MAG: hypothetical protein IPL46_30845 [Saprospiraceae bacterium]|nr:hypothetical protein [Saprospiraceae bacterium]